MALPLWGALQKAQDNSDTIEDAINAAVVAHEADADSHLGSGESLEAHKTFGVLDHPPGSVLSDKNTFSELFARTNFESTAGWTVTGAVSQTLWLGTSIDASPSGSSPSSLKSEIGLFQNLYLGPSEFLAQWTFQTTNINVNATFDIRLGAPLGSGLGGVGFYWDGSTLKAYVKDSVVDHLSSTLATSISGNYTFRIVASHAEGDVKFYINGELVATLPFDIEDSTDDPEILMQVTRSTAGTSSLIFFDFYIAIPLE
jgi:hypothetical protein